MTVPPPNFQYQQPKPNPGLTFLGMSGGVLFLVIALVILLPLICCGVLFFAGVLGMATSPAPSLSPTPSGF